MAAALIRGFLSNARTATSLNSPICNSEWLVIRSQPKQNLAEILSDQERVTTALADKSQVGFGDEVTSIYLTSILTSGSSKKFQYLAARLDRRYRIFLLYAYALCT